MLRFSPHSQSVLSPSHMAARRAFKAVRCHHCGSWIDVPGRSQTSSCPRCYRQITTADVHVRKVHWGGSLRTCGRLFVGERGRVITKLAIASAGAEIRGSFEGLLVAGGPVLVAATGLVRGGIRAPRLIVEPGAILEGGPFALPADPIGSIDLEDPAWRRYLTRPMGSVEAPVAA